MLRVCQSIRTSSLPDKENQAIFAARSPTAIRNIRPLSLRPKQIPETSRSGTSTTRRTRSRFLFDLRFPIGVGRCGLQGHTAIFIDISRVRSIELEKRQCQPFTELISPKRRHSL